MNCIDLDPALIELMRKGIKNINHNDTTFRMIGKGGEALIYKYDDDTAIKIYHTAELKTVRREAYITSVLKSIDQISDHIIELKCVEETNDILHAQMELNDGDLNVWTTLATNRETVASEDDWLSMIFQMTFALYDINDRGVVHNDPKPKNMLYKVANIKNKTYKINTDSV